MRILTGDRVTGDRVLFTGKHLCPEFDCPLGPLPQLAPQPRVLLRVLSSRATAPADQLPLTAPAPSCGSGVTRSVLLSRLSGTNSGANFGFIRVLHDDPSHMCRLRQGANQ